MKYNSINGIFTNFVVMIVITAFCIFKSLQNTEFVVVLTILLLVHILQWVTINLQLFSSKQMRMRKAAILACMTVLFNFLIPSVSSIGLFMWLIVRRNYYYELAFKWIMCDLVLCTFGSIAFLIKLERIAFEQYESSEASIKKHDRSGPKSTEIEPLVIDKDYYALAFCSMMKHYKKKASITKEQQAGFFVNVCFIFAI